MTATFPETWICFHGEKDSQSSPWFQKILQPIEALFTRKVWDWRRGFIPHWVISVLRLFQNPCKWSKFLWSKQGYWGSISKLRKFGAHSEQREFGSDWKIGSRPFAWNVMPWPPFRLKIEDEPLEEEQSISQRECLLHPQNREGMILKAL